MKHTNLLIGGAVLVLFVIGSLIGQGLNQSGGAGTNVIANAGTNLNTSALALEAGNLALIKAKTDNLDVALSTRLKPADTLAGITTLGAITNALPTGTNLIGYIKQRPAGCTAAGTNDVIHDVVGIATGGGTSVSAIAGCVMECFINNITNSPVTLRLQDKAGTPVIWIGGGTDFAIPQNSNMGCGGNGGLNIAGITFTGGITAIAGTAAALNLHLVTRE